MNYPGAIPPESRACECAKCKELPVEERLHFTAVTKKSKYAPGHYEAEFRRQDKARLEKQKQAVDA